jgi:Tfp pilus assembly protein PilF
VKTQSFRLQIGKGPAKDYVAQVLLSPRGEGSDRLALPFSAAEVAGLTASFARSISGGRHVAVEEIKEPELSPEALGERLFAALFQGEILSLYERSLEADTGVGLRLELMLDPRDPDLAAVQALPWELLRKPGTSEFLALSPQSPIVRYLAVSKAVKAARQPGTLRILAVAASPTHKGLDRLDLASELSNLQEAVSSSSAIEIVTPERPTLAGLRQALLDHKCHVLHFMGHGGSVPGQAERVLFLETEEGNAEPVRGTDLVNKLAGFSLRLVVLNACESAGLPDYSTGAERFEPFAGVANTLVLSGLPAVVAMQFPISDPAAIAFSRVFYQRLAAGEPVDAAVAEGRQALHSAAPTGFEWATPVLFQRTPTGELFPEKDVSPEPSRKPIHALLVLAVLAVLVVLAVVSFREARALRVHTLVTEGATLFGHEKWPEARDRFEAARNLAPHSAEVLSDLAGAEERLGDPRAAEEHYREAARLRPDSAEHLYNLGHFLNSRRSYPEAYDVLQRSLALDPERADAYADLAETDAARGMLGRARLSLETALRKAPDRPALHRRLGALELEAGQPQAAIPHLQEARRYPMAEREQAETAALLLQAYDRLGDSSSACGEVAAFRRLDRPGITPWAPDVEVVATRRRCLHPE